MASKKYKGIRSRLLLAALLMVSMLIISIWIYFSHFKPSVYEAFGINIPGQYGFHGIDVSRYQERIDWEAVSEMRSKGMRISFAFIKATEGKSRVDGCFSRNWRLAGKAGLKVGAYHFFLPDRSAAAQARHFINTVPLLPGHLPPVLDVEEHMGEEKESIRSGVLEWLRLVENRFGVKPIIYTNIHFYKKYLGSEFDEYPFWVAHYLQPVRPRISRKWQFWQHSESGRVNGISSKVDFNVFNGDSLELERMLIQSVSND
jgi:lysozyme